MNISPLPHPSFSFFTEFLVNQKAKIRFFVVFFNLENGGYMVRIFVVLPGISPHTRESY